MPDYIKPDAPFNPRAMAREAGLPGFAREMDLAKLLEHYTATAAKDIFNTSIIQNNKAFIQQLDTLGYPNSARLLENWTAESFSGVKAQLDRAVALNAEITRGMNWWRRQVVRNVFPLNFGGEGRIRTIGAFRLTSFQD